MPFAVFLTPSLDVRTTAEVSQYDLSCFLDNIKKMKSCDRNIYFRISYLQK